MKDVVLFEFDGQGTLLILVTPELANSIGNNDSALELMDTEDDIICYLDGSVFNAKEEAKKLGYLITEHVKWDFY